MKRNHAKNLDCNGGVCMYFSKFLMQENDITSLNVSEMKTDITKQMKLRHTSLCIDLSRNKSLDFTIDYIGMLCYNLW